MSVEGISAEQLAMVDTLADAALASATDAALAAEMLVGAAGNILTASLPVDAATEALVRTAVSYREVVRAWAELRRGGAR